MSKKQILHTKTGYRWYSRTHDLVLISIFTTDFQCQKSIILGRDRIGRPGFYASAYYKGCSCCLFRKVSSSVRSSRKGVIDTRSFSTAQRSVPSSAGSSGFTLNQ